MDFLIKAYLYLENMTDFPFFGNFAKICIIKSWKVKLFLTNSKRRDFEDSKTPGLFEKWAILVDLMANFFEIWTQLPCTAVLYLKYLVNNIQYYGAVGKLSCQRRSMTVRDFPRRSLKVHGGPRIAQKWVKCLIHIVILRLIMMWWNAMFDGK